MFAVFELLLSLSSSFCELCDPCNLPSRIADRFSLGFVCQGHVKARRDLTVTGILGPTRYGKDPTVVPVSVYTASTCVDSTVPGTNKLLLIECWSQLFES